MYRLKTILFLLFLFSRASVAQCNFAAPASTHELTYSFEPLIAGDSLRLRVTLEFKSGGSGKTTVILPSEWAGQHDAYKSVTELAAISPHAVLKETKKPENREVQSPPNSVVRLRYLLIKQWSGPLDAATRFYADLSPEYFHLIGITSLVHPRLRDFEVVDVHFDWSKLPKEWSLATSFAADERCQSFHGSWLDALNSLFVGGDYRIYRKTVAENALIFAIRGRWSFTDDEWTGQVSKIIEFQRTFWHDNHFPYFLITLTPFTQEQGSQGGTALTNAFMEHLSRQDSISSQVLKQLSHENFHSWNPYRIGSVPDPEEKVSWFYEGFTGYYEDLMLFRAGMTSFPDYVNAMDRTLRNYGMGEGIDVSLDEFVRRHHSDHSALDGLERRRGAVIAAWLDATIRQQSRTKASLDDLMFYLARQNADYRGTHHDKPMALTNKRIFSAAARYITAASAREFRRYAESGGVIRVPDNALGPCVQSRTEMIGNFELGFDRSSISAEPHRVVGVQPESEAYKAGLRDGQQLIGWSIVKGDPTKQVKLTIKTASGRQVITYYPQGKKLPVQQFVLDQSAYNARPEICSAGFWR